MPYSYQIVTSLTGADRVDVTAWVVDPKWGSRANGAGRASVSLRLRPASFTRDQWRSLTAHWSRTFVVSWDTGVEDVAVAAFLIESRSWDADAGTLTLNLVELENELDWRMITAVTEYSPGGSLELSGLSKRGMVRQIVARALKRTPALPGWDYPVELPAAEAGSEGGTYANYEFSTLGSLAKKWQDTDGGPDVHLDPEWRGKLLVWVLRVGSPRLPGAVFEFSQSAEDSPVLSPLLSEDGSRMTTGVFAVGQGSEVDMRVGLGPSSAAGVVSIPFRDRSIAHKTIGDVPHLNALAIADLKAHFGPIRQKSFGLQISDLVTPDVLRVGSRVRVWTDGDEFEPEGWFDGYLIGVSGSQEMRLGLEVQPWA